MPEPLRAEMPSHNTPEAALGDLRTGISWDPTNPTKSRQDLLGEWRKAGISSKLQEQQGHQPLVVVKGGASCCPPSKKKQEKAIEKLRKLKEKVKDKEGENEKNKKEESSSDDDSDNDASDSGEAKAALPSSDVAKACFQSLLPETKLSAFWKAVVAANKDKAGKVRWPNKGEVRTTWEALLFAVREAAAEAKFMNWWLYLRAELHKRYPALGLPRIEQKFKDVMGPKRKREQEEVVSDA
jgi:hypothetical protein